MQDPILKKIFAIPTMVELLVRRYRSDLAPTIAFSTIRQLPNELLSKQLDKRVPDMLFLADCRGESRKVLLHIEFQATSDAEMPLRNLVYVGLAAQKLLRHFRNLGESTALVVVSMVLYHGTGPWNAPVTVEDLVPGLTEYTLVRPAPVGPGSARPEDIPGMVLGLLVPGQTPAALRRRLDTLKRALEPGTDPKFRARIAAQLRPVLASVYDHSLLKETSPMATMLEVFTEARDADRASARKEGRLEGQARVIMRHAKQRFGHETARNLERLLADVTDPDRMDRVADAVIDCGGGGECSPGLRGWFEPSSPDGGSVIAERLRGNQFAIVDPRMESRIEDVARPVARSGARPFRERAGAAAAS